MSDVYDSTLQLNNITMYQDCLLLLVIIFLLSLGGVIAWFNDVDVKRGYYYRKK